MGIFDFLPWSRAKRRLAAQVNARETERKLLEIEALQKKLLRKKKFKEADKPSITIHYLREILARDKRVLKRLE